MEMVVDAFASAYGARRMTYDPLEQNDGQARLVKQVFGQDMMPDLDIGNAGAVLSFGADFLNTWMIACAIWARLWQAFRDDEHERGAHSFMWTRGSR